MVHAIGKRTFLYHHVQLKTREVTSLVLSRMMSGFRAHPGTIRGVVAPQGIGDELMKKQLSRRSFMQHAVVASVAMPLIVPRLSFAAPPSGMLQHAGIGVGAQGAHDLGHISSHEKVKVVALCDIDAVNLERASQLHPEARLYRDWREMLDAEAGNIDSVNVSTPDHTHAVATISALRQGINVFCEKPLTKDVYEARKVAEAAVKAGVATQMGNQIHSHDFYRTAVQWMQEGAIGKIKEWHSWCGATYTTETKMRAEGADPIPDSLDWDLWLGTAPERPFKDKLYHPFWWRNYRDFGGGATGDFGCHIFDTVFTALEIGAPITVTCRAECVSDEVHPGWSIADYVFPGTPLTEGKTIHATWMDGGMQPSTTWSTHLPEGYQLPPSGSMVIGADGTLIIPHVGAPKLYPEEKFSSYPQPELEPKDHYHEFVEAALGNGATGSHFAYAGNMTEAVLLATIANRFPGKTLEWDPKRLRIKNLREANGYLRRNYRKGWDVKGL